MVRTRWIGLTIPLLLLSGIGQPASAADWPTPMHDPGRSAVTADVLRLPLALCWTYIPAQSPDPAWPEPGKELHRIDFDYAFHPVVAAGMVYIASSADDTLRALDAATGALCWQFTADAPLRLAPTVHDGLLYIASDDGNLYCLDAGTGAERWHYRAGPDERLLLGNERVVSRWPCRSGAVVLDDTVYCAAGMWPTEDVYVFALEARTGNVVWRNDSSGTLYLDLPHPGAFGFSGVAPQGYLVVRDDVVLVATGRCVPAAFDRRTGKLLYFKPAEALYHGGSWLTTAGGIYFNARNRFQNPSHAFVGEAAPAGGDGLFVYSLTSGDTLATLAGTIRAVVDKNVLYGAGSTSLWAAPLDRVLAQKRLAPGSAAWQTELPARTYTIIKTANTIVAGCDGAVVAVDASDGNIVWQSDVNGQVRALAAANGALYAATQTGELHCWGAPQADAAPATRIVEARPVDPLPESVVARAAHIVKETGATAGYALVTGEPDTALAEALARQSDLHVVCALSTSPDRLAAARSRLIRAGLYGRRVWPIHIADGADLPLAPYFADLVVISGEGRTPAPGSCYAVLRPYGGRLVGDGMSPGAWDRFVQAAGLPEQETLAGRCEAVRGALPGAGQWRYPWADGGRTGIGDDNRVRLPLELLWFGGPGPDRLMDRHLMTAPPVFADGRVFLTGEHDVIAFDAYNGRELWCTRIPDVGRKYAQYYSSNLVADDTSAFVATKDTCLRLDRETGNVLRAYAIPDPVVKDTPAQTTGNYMSVDWPITWHVAGPFPKGSPLPAADQLTALPKRLTLGETVCETRPLNAVDGRLDFTVLFGAPGLKPPKEQSAADSLPRQMPKPLVHWAGQVAVAYAEIVCDRPGTLMVGAGADWWMSWTLDGKPVFDTLKGGNEPSRHTYWSRTTCTDTDYLFPVDVEAGRHVIAVVVKSGSRGWSLASASQGAAVATVMPVVTGDDNVPNLRDLVWGYLSVVDDLVLGTYAVPVAAGQDAESQLIARSESKALFALDKASGSLRWVVRPRPGRTFSNIEIAFGDGRIFALDATSKADSVRALRRGETPEVAISLAAFDLASGAELWRQDDVPVLRDRSMPTRLKSNPTHLFMGLPNWGHLMYADGVVLLAANAAYDAETGEKLWENTVRPQKLPVVLDNWVISHPYAYRLHTGEQRMDTDQLTGETVPWRYDRAYGCGPINGCRNLLFFRSGTDGFYDVHTGGTTNFGGVRPSCGRSLIAAGGMMIHPEGYSGCCCSYNYQTSLALVPAPTTKSTWYVYPRRSSTGLIRRIALNFGAPGDRSAADGTAWLGYPRPMIGNACPAPARLQLENAQCIIKGGAGTQTATRDAPWVYSSALAGEGRITLGLTLTTDAAIPSLPETPNIDGNLDDRAWDNAAALPFETTPLNVMGAGIDFQAGISSDALCFRYARGSIAGTAQDRTPTGDAAGAEDIQIYVTDLRRKTGIRIGVARDGTRFATLGNVDRYRKVQPGWQATWSAAVRENGDRWEAEIALPLPVLEDAGINPRKLQINAMSRNRTDAGLAPAFLTDPLYGADFRRCVRFVRIAQNPRELPPERRFTVTLHFAEVDEKAGPGDRVFTVALQGTPVLSNLDIAGRTGGANRPFVHAVPGVRAGDAITVELTPEHGGTSRLPPLINGLDIVEETN